MSKKGLWPQSHFQIFTSLMYDRINGLRPTDEPLTVREGYMWLVMNAAYRERNSNGFIVKAGELVALPQEVAECWGCADGYQLKEMFQELRDKGLIEYELVDKTFVFVRVIDYDLLVKPESAKVYMETERRRFMSSTEEM